MDGELLVALVMVPAGVWSMPRLRKAAVVSGPGRFHVGCAACSDYPGDRVGHHLASTDGTRDWTDQGLACDPRYAQEIFSYADGTVNHWYEMERPGIALEDGLVTYATFAVSDVNKDNQSSAGTDHGSKVIVVPFDGAAFDRDCRVPQMRRPGQSSLAPCSVDAPIFFSSPASFRSLGSFAHPAAGTAARATATGWGRARRAPAVAVSEEPGWQQPAAPVLRRLEAPLSRPAGARQPAEPAPERAARPRAWAGWVKAARGAVALVRRTAAAPSPVEAMEGPRMRSVGRPSLAEGPRAAATLAPAARPGREGRPTPAAQWAQVARPLR